MKITKFLFWLTPLALTVILTSCKPPCDGPNCPLPEQTVSQTVIDQIEKNGKAADGQDFIAAPPVGWIDPIEAQVRRQMRDWQKNKTETK